MITKTFLALPLSVCMSTFELFRLPFSQCIALMACCVRCTALGRGCKVQEPYQKLEAWCELSLNDGMTVKGSITHPIRRKDPGIQEL